MSVFEFLVIFLLGFICCGVFATGWVIDDVRDILREIKNKTYEVKNG